MRASLFEVLAACIVVISAVGTASALEGEFTPETRKKLASRITAADEHATLEKLVRGMLEETGLSVVAPLPLVRGSEPIVFAANNATVEELIDAIAFVLHLEVMATPNGVIAFRLPRDDPRRQARPGRPPLKGEEAAHPPPAADPDRVIAQVSQHPEVREMLERTGGRLFFQKFHPEKRVWILAVRAGPKEPPHALVFANEDGGFVGVKKVGRGKDKGDKGEERQWEKPRRWEKPRPAQKEHF